MASVILKYNLEEIEDIIFKGFDYRIPDDVMEKISNLSMQVGSPDYIKTPIFKKRDNPMKDDTEITILNQPPKDHYKKRRGNKNMEDLAKEVEEEKKDEDDSSKTKKITISEDITSSSNPDDSKKITF